jgi:glycerol-3-phosphate acyltransferase PlsY
MLELAVKSIAAYLAGAVMGSLVLGRLRGVDIRELGSGNAGGTNALRTQGAAFAIGVVIIDIGKGWLAAGWLPRAAIPGLPFDPALDRQWLTGACALAAIAGHVYPIWFGFRGGKGGATLVGAALGIDWALLVPALAVWLLLVMLTGFVSLGTMAAAIALAVASWFMLEQSSYALTTAFAAAAALILYAHRDNVARLLAGNENRARRLWLFGR